MSADDILDALAELLAERVAAKLQPKPVDAGVYSSEQLPPDCPSRKRFHVVVRAIPGAEKRGRAWFVPADAWRAARVKRTVEPNAAPTADNVDAIIAAAGFRRTR